MCVRGGVAFCGGRRGDESQALGVVLRVDVVVKPGHDVVQQLGTGCGVQGLQTLRIAGGERAPRRDHG